MGAFTAPKRLCRRRKWEEGGEKFPGETLSGYFWVAASVPLGVVGNVGEGELRVLVNLRKGDKN